MTGTPLVLALIFFSLLFSPGPASAEPSNTQELMVAAASDLSFPFKEIGPLFERACGAKVTFIFGSTGQLAKQVEHGAPVDVFFAADTEWVDYLKGRGKIVPESQSVFAQGRIVLATAKRLGMTLTRLEDLLKPEVRRIAIANPSHAPYGRAAREALEHARLWEQLKPRLVYGENIRQALQFIQSGNAQAGIIAVSVAQATEIISVPIDGALYTPLNQSAAVIRRSRRPELGTAFIRFVAGPHGRPIMKRYGFLLPGEF